MSAKYGAVTMANTDLTEGEGWEGLMGHPTHNITQPMEKYTSKK